MKTNKIKPRRCGVCKKIPRISSYANESWLFECGCGGEKAVIITGTKGKNDAICFFNLEEPEGRLTQKQGE